MKATARANTNIALIKYWGKRDEKLFLPMNSSISITLDKFYTTTTVEYKEELKNDILIMNNKLGSPEDQHKVSEFLNKVRKIAGVELYANIITDNQVPTAAGFASSASGYAALAAAATKAIGLNISLEVLSRIARQGSGSACRSIYGGFVEWEMGQQVDGMDSQARQILSEDEWRIAILSVVIASGRKKVSSREGMKRTVETSPFYQGWLDTVMNDIEVAKRAIINKDFVALGEVMEENAFKMHATMMGAKPPILYWDSGTLEVIHCIQGLRQAGIAAYITIDAGPNVKVLCLPDAVQEVKKSILALSKVQDVIVCYPGKGVRMIGDY